MQHPRSLPLRGSVHPRENRLHKGPAFQTKGMSKEIPLLRGHTLFRSVPDKSMPPLPSPFRPPPFIYLNSSTSTPLPALPLANPRNPNNKVHNWKSTQVNLREERLHQIHRVKTLFILFFLGPPRPIIHIFPCSLPPPYILSMHADQGYVLAYLHIYSTLPAF